MMKRPIGFLLLCLLSAGPLLAQARTTDSLETDHVVGPLGARLDTVLTRYQQYGFWGSVLAAQRGQIVLLKGYGLADLARNIPNTAATRFEMNSITKTFTAAAILQLAAAGRLAVTDPVERHLGSFPPDKRAATIEQLAIHTAGLVVGGATLATETRDGFVESVKRTPQESPPGQEYRYSNAGFSLLGAVIEKVTGESFEAYLRHRLFPAAGMRTALFRDEVPANDPRFARGYVGTPAALAPGPDNPYIWSTRGAGGVWSTVGDMYRWVITLDQGRVVPDRQRALLFVPRPGREGYGWHVDTVSGRVMRHKGGGSSDFASQVLHYPEDQVVIVWASNNLRQRWRRTLNRNLAGVVFGDSVDLPPPVVPLSPTALRSLAGRFTISGRDFTIHAGEGFLYSGQNAFGIPTSIMFFPTATDGFTGLDPSSGAVTVLRFDDTVGSSISIALPDGKVLRASRSGSNQR